MAKTLWRRTLIFLIAVAFGSEGCSGNGGTVNLSHAGGSGGSGAATSAPTAQPGPSAAPAGTAMQSGQIVLPPGVSLAMSSLTVTNSVGTATPKSDGTFSISAYTGGAQYATVTDQKGTLVLAGFLGSQDPTLDVTSTAKVVLYFEAGFYMLPSPYRAGMVDQVATVPGFSAVVSAISSALATNPDALASSTTAAGITSAVTTFIQQFFSPTSTSSVAQTVAPMLREKRQDVSASPSQFSGITVNPAYPPDGVTFTNTLRRPSEAFFDEVSYVDAGGTKHQNPVTDAIPEMDIPAVTAIPANIPQAYAQAIAAYFTGQVPYGPVTTAETATPLNDSTDMSTTYQVTVVGLGAIQPNVTLTQEWSTAKEQLGIKFLLLDMFLPIIMSCITTVGSESIDNALNFQGSHAALATLIDVVTSTAPELINEMESGDVTDALATLRADFGNSDVLRAALAQFFVTATTVGTGLDAHGQHLQVNLAVEDAEQVLKIINVAGAVLAAADFSKVAHDIATSDSLDQFTLTVTQDLVKIAPTTATVPVGTTQVFTLNALAANSAGDAVVYQWANTATVGHLTDGINGHEDNFMSSSNTVTYTADPTGDGGTDTVTGTAFLVQGQNRVQIGEPQKAVVTVTSGLQPETVGPITVPFNCGPAGDGGSDCAGQVSSYVNGSSTTYNYTVPDATTSFDVQTAANEATGGTIVSTLEFLPASTPPVTGTPFATVAFQVNDSPALPVADAPTFYSVVRIPASVALDLEGFTCSLYQGTTLVETFGGAILFPTSALSNNEYWYTCEDANFGQSFDPDGAADTAFNLNEPYEWVFSTLTTSDSKRRR